MGATAHALGVCIGHWPVASVGVVSTPGCEEACFRELPELKGLGKL